MLACEEVAQESLGLLLSVVGLGFRELEHLGVYVGAPKLWKPQIGSRPLFINSLTFKSRVQLRIRGISWEGLQTSRRTATRNHVNTIWCHLQYVTSEVS